MNPVVAWQIAAFGVLGVAILAGFVWYERHRPPARIAATIATLVAFAVVGRILFAPFPNMKPTTDIVMLGGYVLGGAPGFMVGALTGLVSNFYFGQGPWTPWQMTAWGVVGVAGALTARATGGRLGRFGLALMCVGGAVVFALIVNLSEVIAFTGQPSTRGVLVVYARALPFDFAHALANFVFCMIAGPTLVRILRRLRRRGELSWPAPVDAAARPVAAVQQPRS